MSGAGKWDARMDEARGGEVWRPIAREKEMSCISYQSLIMLEGLLKGTLLRGTTIMKLKIIYLNLKLESVIIIFRHQQFLLKVNSCHLLAFGSLKYSQSYGIRSAGLCEEEGESTLPLCR